MTRKEVLDVIGRKYMELENELETKNDKRVINAHGLTAIHAQLDILDEITEEINKID